MGGSGSTWSTRAKWVDLMQNADSKTQGVEFFSWQNSFCTRFVSLPILHFHKTCPFAKGLLTATAMNLRSINAAGSYNYGGLCHHIVNWISMSISFEGLRWAKSLVTSCGWCSPPAFPRCMNHVSDGLSFWKRKTKNREVLHHTCAEATHGRRFLTWVTLSRTCVALSI